MSYPFELVVQSVDWDGFSALDPAVSGRWALFAYFHLGVGVWEGLQSMGKCLEIELDELLAREVPSSLNFQLFKSSKICPGGSVRSENPCL